jgi:hypothetical protein
MGVRYLQSVLKLSCSIDAIHKIHLDSLSNKTIVVDVSIYIYKGVGEDALLEQMIVMLSLFRKYDIRAIFVFDGKTPAHKSRIVRERQQKKKQAEELYNLAVILGNQDEVSKLKKHVTRVNDAHIRLVKELILAFGAEYCEASGEADEVCAVMVLNGTAWACMTEDMDLFLYGCPRILRQFSAYNETVVLNDLPRILSDLEMNSVDEFRRIVVSTGLSDCTNASTSDSAATEESKSTSKVSPDFIILRDAIKSRTMCAHHSSTSDDNYRNLESVVLPTILGNYNTDVDTRTQDVLYKNGIVIV